jgi:hypothetical protein
MPSGYQNFLSKIFLEPAPSSTSSEPVLSSSPPQSLCTIIHDHGQGPYAPPSSPTRAGAAIDNAGLVAVLEPATTSSSLRL